MPPTQRLRQAAAYEQSPQRAGHQSRIGLEMLEARRRLREILAKPECTIGASIFDPMSARIADMLGWEICKLPGSTGKAADLAVPDEISLANPSDLVDLSRRITRCCDAPLVVDAD